MTIGRKEMVVSLDADYEKVLETLGFVEEPFAQGQVDSRFYYMSPYLAVVSKDIIKGIKNREGLQITIGERGLGKTSFILRLQLLFWPNDAYSVITFNGDSYQNNREAVASLLKSYNLSTKGRYAEKVQTIRRHLENRARNEFQTIWLIDNAQDLPNDIWELIIQATETKNGVGKGLQVICFSTPEMIDKKNPIIYGSARYHTLLPFSQQDVAAMVNFRCRTAGREYVFTDQAILKIFEASRGIPMNIVAICRDALKAATELRETHVNLTAVDRVLASLKVDKE